MSVAVGTTAATIRATQSQYKAVLALVRVYVVPEQEILSVLVFGHIINVIILGSIEFKSSTESKIYLFLGGLCLNHWLKLDRHLESYACSETENRL